MRSVARRQDADAIGAEHTSAIYWQHVQHASLSIFLKLKINQSHCPAEVTTERTSERSGGQTNRAEGIQRKQWILVPFQIGCS